MVNNSTYINKTKENINSNGQAFHQYQQYKNVTYIEKVILILYTRLELKTLVLSAKENYNWIPNFIRRGLLILC
jgi:hypothetical protein